MYMVLKIFFLSPISLVKVWRTEQLTPEPDEPTGW